MPEPSITPMRAETGSPSSTEVRICGNCRWIRGPGSWDIDQVYGAGEAGFMELVKAVDYCRRRFYRCTRERCWVHLLDEGCSLWEPRKEGGESEQP